VRTLLQWKNQHPHVNVLAFESNYNKRFGFGRLEDVCGFCLASYFFDDEPPEVCRYCRAPIQEANAISDLPDIAQRKYAVSRGMTEGDGRCRGKLFIVKREPEK